MSLITVNNLSISFCGKTLFDGDGFQINKGDRIGLVGPNGAGKTTLLRLLIGEVFPDNGEVSQAKGIRIGYLSQEISIRSGGALLASVLDSIPGKVERDQRLQKLEKSLKKEYDPQRQMELTRRMADLYDEMNYYSTRFSSHRAEEILVGLGFSPHSFKDPLDELSGGWKMRAALAGLLFQEPDILLLDEPTNHLDFPSVLWLEDFLINFKHCLMLICHDRKFLNRQINHVISLEPEGLRVYTGNYNRYVETRNEEETVLNAKARNQEKRVSEAKCFIERFRAKSTKARQAQSKIKMLEKMEIIRTHKKLKVMSFSFPQVERSGETALSIRGLTKGFHGECLYNNQDLFVRRGERVAVIGKNGVGKTTLLKMIAGEVTLDEGTITQGHNVTMSYYAQHHTEFLNENSTILEEVYRVIPDAGISFVRGVCGAFLFSGDDVEKPISVLSGGEKARVALARILVKPGNLMVMDEPTNHLDLLSCEVLTEALHDYGGTLVFVSHNQGLINRLATKIWDISDGRVEEYPGNLEEYLCHLDLIKKDFPEEAGDNRYAGKGVLRNKETIRERRQRKARERQVLNRELSPIKEELADIEEYIDELERQEKILSGKLADPEIYGNTEESVPLVTEYGNIKKELEKLLKKWECQQEVLETARKRLKFSFQ